MGANGTVDKRFARNYPAGYGLGTISKKAAAERAKKEQELQKERAELEAELAHEYDELVMSIEELQQQVAIEKRAELVAEAAKYVDVMRRGRQTVSVNYANLPSADPRFVGYNAVMEEFVNSKYHSDGDTTSFAIVTARTAAARRLLGSGRNRGKENKIQNGIQFAVSALEWAMPRMK